MPMLAVPLLIGGVAGADIGFALALEAGVVFGSVAAGFFASSLAERWGRAIALATLLAILIGEALALLSFVGFAPLLLANERSARGDMLFIVAFVGPWILGTGLIGPGGFSGLLAQSPPWMTVALLTALLMVFAGSIVAIVLAWRFAARRIQRFGSGQELTVRQEERHDFWFKARSPLLIRSRRQRVLGRHPMIWLYTFDPFSGLVRWAWCAVVLVVWFGVLWAGIDENDTEPWVFGLPVVLIIGMALSAASSFRREMEEGTFELLLVAPIRPAEILWARLFAFWSDFLPSMLLSVVLALWWMAENGNKPANLVMLGMVVSSFFTVPIVGARLSVRRLNPLTAWLWTLGLTFFLPAGFGLLVGYEEYSMFSTRSLVSFVSIQLVEAAACVWVTINDLSTRQFQLKPLRRTPG
jgi:ABC-type transport system involved in multi-copper enzyme maturation permease subunit